MMERIEHTDVAIVGAGGGGAVLALALVNKGVRTLVLEQASGPPQGLRGEILQPNGQRILDRLGLLGKLPGEATRSVRYFHFYRVGGERLCTIDYGVLPPPFNRAIVTLPNVAHHVILSELEARNPGRLWYGAKCSSLLFERGRVVGLIADCGGALVKVSAKLVVGADGVFSKVREALKIPARLHLYPEGYLIAVLDTPQELADARYFLGPKTILGVFPAAGRKVYLFYMIPAGTMEQVKAQGLLALQEQWIRIDPSLEATFRGLKDWEQTAYMPTGRVRASRWVADGAALIGDAAHAMNPHASQGRMQAMVDAMTLADVIPTCLESGDWSAEKLRVYERHRRPQVDMLQRLADEQVVFWNTGNPLLGWLRDRVFRTLDRNPRLRYQVLAATAGLRARPPFGLLDRLMAVGFLPDPRAQHVSPETTG
ncbi:MAG: monooxygenase [Nitrospiraceae bacterium]|nr:MAG: monooxygenase [Nitrospiraceae bacterium]